MLSQGLASETAFDPKSNVTDGWIMRFEVRSTYSFRIRVTRGEGAKRIWEASVFIRPWLAIDFSTLGKSASATIGRMRTLIKQSSNPQI